MLEPVVIFEAFLWVVLGRVAVIGSDEVDHLVVSSVPAFGLGHKNLQTVIWYYRYSH